MTFTTARRTTLRRGAAERYDEVHASIPAAVDAVLRRAGILSWQIWRDGDRLFHLIESTRPYEVASRELDAAPPPDPEWAALIASLLSSEPEGDRLLTHVWTMGRS